MPARILDGKRVGLEIREEVKREAEALARKGVVPGLAAVLVGDDPASKHYINSKTEASGEASIHSDGIFLPGDTSADTLSEKLDQLNERDDIDAILLQLPLPDHLDAADFIPRVRPDKDVDGLHALSVGRLVQKQPGPRPCTPAGVMELLRRENVPIEGQRAVVLGRSDIVGKPMAMLLLHANATVTLCHSRTRDLPAVTREADILVAAIGRAGFVRHDFIKPGAVVVDVGQNVIEEEEQVKDLFGEESKRMQTFRKKGTALVGDVHPREAMEVASAFTPVPGGVGPLTIAMLLFNTVELARARRAR